MLGAKDARGNPKKSGFGPWMMKAFAVLSRLKSLRFSPLNVFARHPDRRLELDTLKLYEADIDRIAATADDKSLDAAIRLAAWPEEIAGYGHIRVDSIGEAMARRAESNQPFQAKI